MSDEMKAPGIDGVRAEELRRLTAAGSWQPGQVMTTPGARLSWSNLEQWIEAWKQLQSRRHSSTRYQQESSHKRALPAALISQETNPTVLYAFLDVMSEANVRSPRGMRDEHPTTPLMVAANNRLAQLGAEPYQRHRQQASLGRKLAKTAPSMQPRQRDALPTGHLSLF